MGHRINKCIIPDAEEKVGSMSHVSLIPFIRRARRMLKVFSCHLFASSCEEFSVALFSTLLFSQSLSLPRIIESIAIQLTSGLGGR